MSENDGGTNQRSMEYVYASPVGTMAPSKLRHWGGGVTMLLLMY